MPYRVRLFDRFDQQISFKDVDSPGEAGLWATEAWAMLLSERVGPPASGEPAEVRHELTFIDANEQERPATDDEQREFAEALATG